MSIAGIAKEVTTITISAWVFGDELTPLNITGVVITICGMFRPLDSQGQRKIFNFCIGIALFTYHKYQKSIDSTVPLDAHGNPVELDDENRGTEAGTYVELDQTDRMNSYLSGAVSEAVSQFLLGLIVCCVDPLTPWPFLGY
jgi:solute carrier family 35, member C2